jgi:hypothetical protein
MLGQSRDDRAQRLGTRSREALLDLRRDLGAQLGVTAKSGA